MNVRASTIFGFLTLFFALQFAILLTVFSLISLISPDRSAILVERPDPAAEGCAVDCGALDPLLVHYDDGQTECLCRPWGC